MKEYKIAKGWAIVMYIGAPFLIVLFGSLLVLPFISGSGDVTIFFILWPVAISMIVIAVLALIDTVKARFVIAADRIYTTAVFNKRMLLFNEIKGYRITDKFIFVEALIKEKKRIKISTYYEKSDEIKQWLFERYDDLDAVNIIAEEKSILEDAEFGRNTAERENHLKRARIATTTLNIIAIALSAWAFFWPVPYGCLMTALILIPVVSVLLLKFSGGIIHLEAKNDSAYPTSMYSIAIPGFILAMRAFVDYNLTGYEKLWPAVLLSTLFFMVVVLIGNKEFAYDKIRELFTILGITVFFFCACFGSVTILNCYYDRSEAQRFYAKVLNKRSSSGKHTSYYIELAPWGSQTESEEVSISSEIYNRIQAGDTVRVNLKRGEFDIPWFYVESSLAEAR